MFIGFHFISKETKMLPYMIIITLEKKLWIMMVVSQTEKAVVLWSARQTV
jgi:hypothetical protein